MGRAWLNFLFGNPVRTLVIAIIALAFVPGALVTIFTTLVAAVVAAVNPVIGSLLALGIVFVGIRFMFTGRIGGKGGGK